jgi:hypothetical protein
MGKNILTEKIRPGYVGQSTVIYDGNGVEYSATQLTKGPAKGIFAAVGIGDKKFSIGWSLLSPNEPISVPGNPLEVTYTNKKTGKRAVYLEKKWVKNIDWKKATELAISRANGLETNPPLPKEYVNQLKNFRRRAFAYFNPIVVNVV